MEDYKTFITEGFVSLSTLICDETSLQHIKTLHETGAPQTSMLHTIVPSSLNTLVGANVFVAGGRPRIS